MKTPRKETSVATTKPERAIVNIGGRWGSGKSFFVASIPNCLIFDTDIGGGLSQYEGRIRRNGSTRVEVSSFVEVLDVLREAARSNTLPPNVAIDHVTGLYNEAILRFNPDGVADYGRSATRATAEARKITQFARRYDFNLFVVTHLKAEYEDDRKVGLLSDGPKHFEADFSVVLHLDAVRDGKYPTTARVARWRRDPDDPRGLPPAAFPFTVEEFVRVHGHPLIHERQEEKSISTEQLDTLRRYVGMVKLPEGKLEAALKRAGAENIEDLSAEHAAKLIEFYEKFLKKGGGEK